MIPILFPANATTFTTNGLGRLPDAVECTVSEERNGPYELFMRYPITGRHYSDIAISRIICAVPADGRAAQPFRIYRMEKPLDGIVSIYAEHISYELNHIPVMPFTASGCAEALTRMVAYSAQDNPFTTWTDKSVSGNFTLDHPEQFRALLGGIQGSILDVYGKGEYEFDGYTVKLYVNRGTDSGVVLRYGKDITSLRQDENIESTITGVCPYWQDAQTGATVTLPEKAVWSATAANYPYKRTAVVEFSGDFQEQPTVAQLRARANQYIEDNDIGIPKISLDVEFVPLRQMQGVSIGNPTRTLVLPATVDGDTLENLSGTVSGDTVTLEDAYWDITYDDYKVLSRIQLCDTVTIRYDALGVNATAKVVKTVYNVLTDRYDSLEIGDARTSLAEQIVRLDDAMLEANSNLTEQVGMLQRYVDHQTELITGGLGGYVVLNYNANGQPEEILIMDAADMTEAVNVIRMNKNGIGFSTSGYAGPFTSAWTIDGVFNASFIGAGTMLANRIAGGILTDLTGQNTWNLTTGLIEFANFAWNATYSRLTADGSLTLKNGETNFLVQYVNYIYASVSSTGVTFSNNTAPGIRLYSSTATDRGDYAVVIPTNNNYGIYETKRVRAISDSGLNGPSHGYVSVKMLSSNDFYHYYYYNNAIHHFGATPDDGTVGYRLSYGSDQFTYVKGALRFSSGDYYYSGVGMEISDYVVYLGSSVCRMALRQDSTLGDGLYVNGRNKVAYTSSSSKRYKHDISNLFDHSFA